MKYLSPSFRMANYAFSVYVSYLTIIWIFFNFGGKGIDPYDGTGFRWLLITIPLLVLMSFHLSLLVLRPKINLSPVIFFLLLYLFTSSFISLIQLDVKHLSEVLRFGLPLILLAHFKFRLSIELLNFLYLLALGAVIILYNPLIDDYGFLPGQTSTNLHQGLWWRISIWKYLTPPYSAAFSLIVLFANYFLNKNISRYIFYILCLYFILLSGNRTSYIILLISFFLLTLFITRRTFRYNTFYSLIPILSVIFIFSLQIFADLIPMLGIQNEFFNSAILRNESSGGNADNLSSRIVIIIEQFRMLQEAGPSGILGIGSSIYDSPGWSANGGRIGQTTDSLITHLIVRDGIASIFLIFSFASFFIESMKDRNIFGYIILLTLLIYTIGYGAWMNSSSPVFLLFLGFIYTSKNSDKDKSYYVG